jgi:hypothetical protein
VFNGCVCPQLVSYFPSRITRQLSTLPAEI